MDGKLWVGNDEHNKGTNWTGIDTETDALRSKWDGKIPKEFLHRTIKEIKGKTLVVFWEDDIMKVKNPDISKKEPISLIRACVAWILTACIFSTLFVMCNLLYNMA